MWEERALRIREALTEVAATGVSVSTLHAEAIGLVGAVVGAELTCWASLDPETLVINAMTSGADRIPAEYEPVLAETEYSPAESHRFAALAVQGRDLVRMSDLGRGERFASERFTRVWRPLGFDRELRLLFSVDGLCWGAAGLVRSGRDFSEREVEFLRAVAPAVATATRLAVRAAAQGTGPCPGRDRGEDPAPAIVVVGPRGDLRSLTPGAAGWRERLDDTRPGVFLTMMRVMAAGVRGSGGTEFRTRMRTDGGRWVALHAAPLLGSGEDLTAVVVEAASSQQMRGLLLAAYALTPRERTICEEVLAGRSTAEISERLFISALTVQDHLKSIFAKFEVHSRGRLVAALQQP